MKARQVTNTYTITSKMKTHFTRIGLTIPAGLLAAATGLMLMAGCATSDKNAFAPHKSGFLSTYVNLKKIDDTTWRFVNTNRVSIYNKFHISAVKCLVTQYDERPVTPEQQQKVVEYLRDSITKALSDRYPIVNSGGPDVGELRVAVTDAYKTGDRLGLSIEGEIFDSLSGYQAAAVMRTELGEAYVGDWWDAKSAKDIIDKWSARLREAIDYAHGR
jgi:hypothetical protein